MWKGGNTREKMDSLIYVVSSLWALELRGVEGVKAILLKFLYNIIFYCNHMLSLVFFLVDICILFVLSL